MKIRNLLLTIIFFTPVILIFRNYFFESLLVSGDAPYFYKESLGELFGEPYLWDIRNNNFGGVNQFFWLSPLMLLWGTLYKLFNIDSNLSIRILFYFPSLIFSILFPYLLTRKLGYSKIAGFFSSLLYVANTYYILLVDGGQIGVVLAYGLFPLTLFIFKLFEENPSTNTFFLSLIIFSLLLSIDPRIAFVGFLLISTYYALKIFLERKNPRPILILLLILFLSLGLNLYWIYPLLKNGISNISPSISSFKFVTILNSLVLYQPHWPANEFGKIFLPPFYFLFLPLLIFIGTFLESGKKNAQIAILFLFFVFLTKGEAPPFGFLYSFLINKIPHGVVFRDSSKFFPAIIILSSILIGNSIEVLNKIFRKPYSYLILGLVYIYLLFLVREAVWGNMNFVLSNKTFHEDYFKIYEKLKTEKNFVRTLWFPESSSFSFHTHNNQAVDAKDLVNLRPFKSLNIGTYDLFNFLHKEQFKDLFEILGIKYLAITQNPRIVNLDNEEEENLNNLKQLVATTSGLKKVNIDTEGISMYETETIKPHLYGTNKLLGIIGDSTVYEKIKIAYPNFEIGNVGFVFFEDENFNPLLLEGISSESAILIFNEKGEEDLSLSFLKDYFDKSENQRIGEWISWDSADYLEAKYQLLVNGIDMQEFDYGVPLSFSNQKNEKLIINNQISNDGNYVLVVRFLSDGKPLKLEIDGLNKSIDSRRKNNFEWFILEDLKFRKGTIEIRITNIEGKHVVNVAALVPLKDFKKAREKSSIFLNHFQNFNLKDYSKYPKILDNVLWKEIKSEEFGTTRYKIIPEADIYWLIMTDNYHRKWKLKRGIEYFSSLPFFSMINGFYIESNWKDTEIIFKGQEDVRWGYYLSFVVGLFIITVYLIIKGKDEDKKVNIKIS